jgi:hypothetical protein
LFTIGWYSASGVARQIPIELVGCVSFYHIDIEINIKYGREAVVGWS